MDRLTQRELDDLTTQVRTASRDVDDLTDELTRLRRMERRFAKLEAMEQRALGIVVGEGSSFIDSHQQRTRANTAREILGR